MTLTHLDLAIGASDALMIRDHVKRFVAIRLRLGGVATPRGSLPIEVDVNQEDLAVTGNCLTPLRRVENFHRDQLTLTGPKYGSTAARRIRSASGQGAAQQTSAINDSII
jgi:hypothetical protein